MRRMGWRRKALAAGVALACAACTSLGGLAGGDSDAGSPDATVDGALPPPPQGNCQSGEKVCGTTCAALTDPAFGCGAPECSPCAGANVAGFVCKGGACVVDKCADGFADCDHDATNGCEADLGAGTNCGACGKACPPNTPICNAGACVAASDCVAPKQVCGTACVDTNSDPAHCGAQCINCGTTPNASFICSTGTCVEKCATGFADCDGVTTNGCECSGGCNGRACCGLAGCPADGGLDGAPPPLDAGTPLFSCPSFLDGGSTGVASCASCIGYTTPCIGCTGAVPSYVCAPTGIDCQAVWPAGTTYCPCIFATDCKYPTQVCESLSACHLCGDVGTNGLACKNGLKCNKANGTCN